MEPRRFEETTPSPPGAYNSAGIYELLGDNFCLFAT
jgi:hypothetical protein